MELETEAAAATVVEAEDVVADTDAEAEATASAGDRDLVAATSSSAAAASTSTTSRTCGRHCDLVVCRRDLSARVHELEWPREAGRRGRGKCREVALWRPVGTGHAGRSRDAAAAKGCRDAASPSHDGRET